MLYDKEGAPRVVQGILPLYRGQLYQLQVSLFNGVVHTVGLGRLSHRPEFAGKTAPQLLEAEDLTSLYDALDEIVLAQVFTPYAKIGTGRVSLTYGDYGCIGDRLKSISSGSTA